MNSDLIFIFMFLILSAADVSNLRVWRRPYGNLRRIRYPRYHMERIIGVPRDADDLPRAEPILPGHTLIRPALTMLKSSVKFPHKDVNMAVYGNLNNLGITYGKTSNRIMYSAFRRSNDLVGKSLLQAFRNIAKSQGSRNADVIIIESQAPEQLTNTLYEDDGGFKEPNFRRMRKKKDYKKKAHADKNKKRMKKFRSDEDLSDETSSSYESSDTSDHEKNPGNPFTLHRGKYIQNWMWNHAMDGDHMNVNPFGPNLVAQGPNGVDFFFGKKWWYFNQDDYKPL